MKKVIVGLAIVSSISSFANTDACTSAFYSSEDEETCIELNKSEELVKACKSAFSGPAINEYALSCIEIAPNLELLNNCKQTYSGPAQAEDRLNCLLNYQVTDNEKSCDLDIRKISTANLTDDTVKELIDELKIKGFNPVMNNAYFKFDIDSTYVEGSNSSGFGFGLLPHCKSHKRQFSISVVNMGQTSQKYVNGKLVQTYDIQDSVIGEEYTQASVCEDKQSPKRWSTDRNSKAVEAVKKLKVCNL